MNSVNPVAIDFNRIESMLAQMKAAAQPPRTEQVAGVGPIADLQPTKNTGRVDFADALKASLDQVNKAQRHSERLGRNFVMGDDSVSLSDVMIAGQKAGIAFQATLQVRNKLVSAYQDVMNMQI